MGKLGTTLLRVAVLAGGAVLGAFVGRWVDEMMNTRLNQQSEYDRNRYEQGLGPIEQRPPTIVTEERQGQ